MNLEFDPKAFDELQEWVKKDQKTSLRILKLINEVTRTPFLGTGKPEPLKGNYSGYWSRRINKKDRLIYKVEKGKLIILACKYHY